MMNREKIRRLRVLKHLIEKGDRKAYLEFVGIVKSDIPASNFHVRIDRETVIELFRLDLFPPSLILMCKEYGQDNNDDCDCEDYEDTGYCECEPSWNGFYREDFDGDFDDVPDHWQTFEIWDRQEGQQ